MLKKILTILLALALAFSFASCGKGQEGADSSSASQSTDEKITSEPGQPAPDGWPKDIPTPVNGEILGGGWSPERSFYTTDIIYKQTDIDAYGERLEAFGFEKQTNHEYGEAWSDATVYSNGQWDVLVAEENDTFEYSYVNFIPLFDAVADGYDGQPEGWPETGGF